MKSMNMEFHKQKSGYDIISKRPIWKFKPLGRRRLRSYGAKYETHKLTIRATLCAILFRERDLFKHTCQKNYLNTQ